MSDPRPTARAMVHLAFVEREWEDCRTWKNSGTQRPEHQPACDRETKLLEADRAASDAREDRLREAIEAMVREAKRKPEWDERGRMKLAGRLIDIAAPALAAIPLRSDR